MIDGLIKLALIVQGTFIRQKIHDAVTLAVKNALDQYLTLADAQYKVVCDSSNNKSTDQLVCDIYVKIPVLGNDVLKASAVVSFSTVDKAP